MSAGRGLARALLLAAALGGCRQALGLDEREVGPTELTPDNYVQSIARAFCEGIETCCLDHGFGFDGGRCEIIVAGSTQEEVSNGLRAGLPFDARAAVECLRASLEQARKCVISSDENAAAARACGRVYRGSTPPGEPCQNDAECAAGPNEEAACSSVDSAAPSYCVVIRDGVEGELCRNGDPFVQVRCREHDGLRCDSFGTGRCEPLGTEGTPCSTFFDCAADFYCRGQACTAKVGVGAPCTPNDDLTCATDGTECLFEACARGLRCDPASRTCAEALPLGAPCVESTQCASDFCGDGNVCKELGLPASPGLCGGVAPQ